MSEPSSQPESAGVQQIELLPTSESERELLEIVSAPPDQSRFSGSRIERLREMVQEIIQLRVAGVDVRTVKRLFRVSEHTIQGILERAEQDGRVATVRERLIKKLARNVEAMADAQYAALCAGMLSPRDLTLPLMAGIDKLNAMTGNATAIVGTKEASGLTVDQAAEAMRAWRQQHGLVIDVSEVPRSDAASVQESAQTAGCQQPSRQTAGSDTKLDATPALSQADRSGSDPGASASVVGASETGGGGRASAGGLAGIMPYPQEILDPKGSPDSAKNTAPL